MSWPSPTPGLVLRYGYLWDREARAGREEGARARPCAIVVALDDRRGRTIVVVVPVTHATPPDPSDAMEIPAEVKRHLGLDEARSWIILTEVNEFAWPGPDLHPRPAGGPESVALGTLPPRLFRNLRERVLLRWRAGRVTRVRRTE